MAMLRVMTHERERLDLLSRASSEASPAVRALVEQLLAPDALTRTRGLDAIAAVVRGGDAAVEGLPYLLSLATSKGYREGSAILARLSAIVAAIDDPPRTGPSDAHAAALWDALRAHLPRLIRHAHRATDPEAARIAACMCSRFPQLDGEVEPLLVALASGARHVEDRARILYALARIQADRGATFHPAVASALHRDALDAETVAVALAIAEHDPPEPLRGRIARTLRAARSGAVVPDPRSWGRSLDHGAIDRALATLET